MKLPQPFLGCAGGAQPALRARTSTCSNGALVHRHCRPKGTVAEDAFATAALAGFIFGSALIPSLALMTLLTGAAVQTYDILRLRSDAEALRQYRFTVRLHTTLHDLQQRERRARGSSEAPLQLPPAPAPRISSWPRLARTGQLVFALLYAACFLPVALRQLLRRDVPLAPRLAAIALPLVWPLVHSLTAAPLLLLRIARLRWVASAFVVMALAILIWVVIDRGTGSTTSIWHPVTPLALHHPVIFVAVVVLAMVGAVAIVALTVRYVVRAAERETRLPLGWLLMVVSDVVRYLGESRVLGRSA